MNNSNAIIDDQFLVSRGRYSRICNNIVKAFSDNNGKYQEEKLAKLYDKMSESKEKVPTTMEEIDAIVASVNSLCGGKTVLKREDLLIPVDNYNDIQDRDSKRREYTIDWTDSHTIIRSVYLMISRYIDEFKRTLAFEKCFDKYAPDCYSCRDIEEAIYDCMLDIPEDMFDELLAFCRGFLKDMNYFDEGYEIWYRESDKLAFISFFEYLYNEAVLEESEIRELTKEEVQDKWIAEVHEMVLKFDLEEAERLGMSLEELYEYREQNRNVDDDFYADFDMDALLDDDFDIADKINYVNYVADEAYKRLREILKV